MKSTLKPTKMAKIGGISRISNIAIVCAILLAGVIIGVSLYYSQTNGSDRNTNTTTTNTIMLVEQNVSRESYSHWNYVTDKNLSSIFSQYSSEYQAVWFFFNANDSLSSLNGKHDCNPAGGVDCSYNVKTAWQAFFNETPSFASHSVCNYSLTVELGERILVSATVWLQASATNQTSDHIATLEVPYQIDFELVGGGYQLWKEYFGLPSDPVVIFGSGASPPPSSQCS